MYRNNLTPAQLDGLACVVCGDMDGDMIPVGHVDGGQVFAHADCVIPACVTCGATDGLMIFIDAHTVACRATCTPMAATSPEEGFDCAHCFEPCDVGVMQLAKNGGDWWPTHRGCVDEARRAGHVVIAL